MRFAIERSAAVASVASRMSSQQIARRSFSRLALQPFAGRRIQLSKFGAASRPLTRSLPALCDFKDLDGKQDSFRGLRAFSVSAATGSAGSATTTSSVLDILAMAPLEKADGTIVEPLTYTWPQDLLLHFMSFCHDKFDMQWATVIIVATLSLRLAVLPLTIRTMQKTSRLAVLKPEIEATIARQKQDPNLDRMKAAEEIKAIYRRMDVNPLSALALPFLQMPLFMSFFFATRKLCDYFPEAATQGMLWFPDLSAPDPLHVMPVIAGLGFIATIKLGADGNPPMEGQMANFQYVMELCCFA